MKSANVKRIIAVMSLLLICYGLFPRIFGRDIAQARAQSSSKVNSSLDDARIYVRELDNQSNVARLGSADKLTGSVYSLGIFVSTPDSSWSYQDKLKMIRQQREAENWMVAQGKRYGVGLSFQNGTYGLDRDISVSNIPSFDGQGKGNYRYWSIYLLKILGYESPLDLWTWLQKNTNCTNLHVIIYANSTGVSYAIPFKQGVDASTFFIEASMMYRYHPLGIELIHSMIAHEVLHLYGAWDLYNSYVQTHDVASKAQSLFLNDIMFRTSHNLEELQVDALTAWRVGWSDKKEPWYEWFRPIE